LTELEQAFEKLDQAEAQVPITVVKGCTIRRMKSGQTVMRLHYSAIPDRDPETEKGADWYRREKKLSSSEAAWKKEQEIDYLAQGGESVFGPVLGNSEYYQQIVISDPNWKPDPTWDVAFGFDHGKTNATALLKAYITREIINAQTGEIISPFDIYFCGEYYSMRRGKSAEEPEGWQNNIDENVKMMLQMPDLDRRRYIVADPAIFNEDIAHSTGDYTSITSEYRDAGMVPFRMYEGVREDPVFAEWLLSDYWGGMKRGKRPRVYIVCRNPADRVQPGLHPYDCPNLLWELKRTRRVELSSKQLQKKNQSEAIVDKHNHARDVM